jgi:hypothetical protein
MSRWTRIATLLVLSLWLRPAVATAGAAADSLALPGAAVRAWQAGTRPDRLEHATIAFTLGLGAGLASRRPAAAAATGAGLGLLKELRDTRHGGFDLVDLAADALGAALSALATQAAVR